MIYLRNGFYDGRTGFAHAARVRQRGQFSGNSSHIVVDNGIEVLDPNFPHIIITGQTSPKMKKYLDKINTPLEERYNTLPRPGGHIEHNNILIRKNPSPDTINPDGGYVLNNIPYEIKQRHTQFNPSWTDDDFLNQFAYAISRKRNGRVLNQKISGHHGSSDPWIEKIYDSELLDGTKMVIYHVNYHRYNLENIFYNYYSNFEPKF